MCRSYIVGKATAEKMHLMQTALDAKEIRILTTIPGDTLKDVRLAVNKYVTDQGLYALPLIGGHGAGAELHIQPHVLFGEEQGRIDNYVLKEGDRITIELTKTGNKVLTKLYGEY